MRRPSISLAAAVLIAALSSTASHSAARVEDAVQRAIAESASGRSYVIVLMRPVEGDPSVVADVVRDMQSAVLGTIAPGDFTPVYRFKSFAGMTGYVTSAGLDALAARPEVESVGLDAMGEGALASSVPYIHADQTYALGITGDGVTVAVLDTGIDTDHPALMDDIAGQYHFLGGGVDVGPGAEDDNGHGSNVSGIITSNGAVGSRGVAPGVEILAVKVLDSTSSGFLSDWAAAVDWVVMNRASYSNLCAINMSLVSFALYTSCPCDNFDTSAQMLQTAINAAKNVGIATFASSGNRGTTSQMPAPACNSAAIPVAAVYDQALGREPNSGTYATLYGTGFGACFDATANPGTITCFSCRNGCNELAAPGRDIIAPYPGGAIASFTGTSQASPHAAAVAALMCRTRLDYGLPPMTPDVVLNGMKATGSASTDPANTIPNPRIIDALRAVNFAVPPSAHVVAPNGGEELLVGNGAVLTWTAGDNVGVSSVDLTLSRTGTPGPFTTIASGVANTGSYAWTVAGPATGHAVLRATARDATSNATSDLSDAEFRITDPTTAVLLASFESAAVEAGIELRWSFGQPDAFPAASLERAGAPAGDFRVIAAERRQEGGAEVALDRDVELGRRYWYRLAATGRDGTVTRFGPIEATAGERRASLQLARVSPNPSAGRTTIEYVLPAAADVSLRVLDVQGREQATLASGRMLAGRHAVTWSGEGAGRPAPAGLYFIQLRSGTEVRSARFVITP
jgi:subtilisin family serine protease